MGDPVLHGEVPSESPGATLRRLRVEAALTLAQVAHAAEVRQSVLIAYELDRRRASAAVTDRILAGIATSRNRPEAAGSAGPAQSGELSDGLTDHATLQATPDRVAKNGSNEKVRETARLRTEVLAHLERQGFKLTPAGLIAPVETDKSKVRSLHDEAVGALRQRGQRALQGKESAFIDRLIAGDQIQVDRIRPRLIPVETYQSPHAPLWRWCSLHWSIPVSVGYGRRLRFLVVDEGHDDAVMGLIGLADPVFALGCRDSAIEWDAAQRAERLTSVLDAFVLGAVPPYSQLLGGKLMAMLSGTQEVRDVFARRYGHRTTVIADRDPNAQLALITTSSALGRSSVYNRVRRIDGSLLMQPVGFTQGSGDFHFSGSIYEELAAFATKYASETTHRHERWGSSGFRNRREVIQRALQALGLPARALRFHGVRRQVFLNPLATNTFEYLRGESDKLDFHDDTVESVSTFWRGRWAVPRSERRADWTEFDPQTWRLYR